MKKKAILLKHLSKCSKTLKYIGGKYLCSSFNLTTYFFNNPEGKYSNHKWFCLIKQSFVIVNKKVCECNVWNSDWQLLSTGFNPWWVLYYKVCFKHARWVSFVHFLSNVYLNQEVLPMLMLDSFVWRVRERESLFVLYIVLQILIICVRHKPEWSCGYHSVVAIEETRKW